jgi:hypothetical protein
MRKELLLLSVLSTIILILLGILIFVPSPKSQTVDIDGLKINLRDNQEISSPLEITGMVSGNGWIGFEGQVGTVKLLNSNGEQLALGILTAQGDWMTSLPINFKTTLNFATPKTENGTLVFRNENPSGLEENNREFILPIKFSKNKTIELKVFFGNMALSSSGQQDECKRVYSTLRYVSQGSKEYPAVAQIAINELLKGTTDQEMLAGFFTAIPKNSKLNSILIIDGVAKADFDQVTESGGGSCSMASRVAQITETLKQFPTVKSVVISINGRTQDIFQP